jgi:hypothetical protein
LRKKKGASSPGSFLLVHKKEEGPSDIAFARDLSWALDKEYSYF